MRSSVSTTGRAARDALIFHTETIRKCPRKRALRFPFLRILAKISLHVSTSTLRFCVFWLWAFFGRRLGGCYRCGPGTLAPPNSTRRIARRVSCLRTCIITQWGRRRRTSPASSRGRPRPGPRRARRSPPCTGRSSTSRRRPCRASSSCAPTRTSLASGSRPCRASRRSR